MLKKKIEQVSFDKDNVHIQISKIYSINGHAEIFIRKGKQILTFEYSCEVDFTAENDTKECTGSFKISEINESDFDFKILSISTNKDSEIGDKVKDILRKNLKEKI